jgi:hypothetical protein
MIFDSFDYDCTQLDEGQSNISFYQGASMMMKHVLVLAHHCTRREH